VAYRRPAQQESLVLFNIDHRNIDEVAIVSAPALDADFNQFNSPRPFPIPALAPILRHASIINFLPPTPSPRAINIRQNEQATARPVQFAVAGLQRTGHRTDTSSQRHKPKRTTHQRNPLSVPSPKLAIRLCLIAPPPSRSAARLLAGEIPRGDLLQATDSYEIQNYTSIATGKHFMQIWRNALD